MFAASKSGQAAAAAAATDPYFPYVPLLLETTSTNGQQNNTFLDSSTNNYTITRTGAVTQGSVTPYWPTGQWSNYFNGSNAYLSRAFTSTTDGMYPQGTTYTCEAWIYVTSYGAENSIYQVNATNTGAFGQWNISTTINTGTLFFSYRTTTGGTAVTLITGSAIPLNTWSHVALSVSSGSAKLFINGTQTGSTASASAISFTPVAAAIGNIANGYTDATSRLFNGYISNFRLVQGIAVYTGTFTPPTSPLATTQSAGTNISAITGTATSLLTCQSNRFLDNSTNNFAITANGAPQVQAFQPFSPTASYTAAAYGGSGYFDGANTSNTHLRSPSVSYTNPSFTVECWFYFNGNPSGQAIFDFAAAANGYGMFAYIDSSTSNLSARFFSANSVPSEIGRIDTPYAKYLNQWIHIAVVFDGTTYKMYLNGVSVGTPISSTTQVVTLTTLTVGARSDATVGSGSAWVGYLSNFRYVRSAAVYTGNFTPPLLAPLTTAGSTSAASYSSTTNVNTSFASSNTVLLLNCTNAGVYDAAVQNNVTTVGDAQASTTQYKWSPTSMKFDGTGDYLFQSDYLGLRFGTGDYTIEFWAYPTGSFASTPVFLEIGRASATAAVGLQIDINTSGNIVVYGGAATATLLITSASTISASNWYYIALVRSSAGTKLYINGSQSGSTATDTTNYNTANLWVGANAGGATAFYTGYLQDIRVTKAARTITTPTAAFPTR